MRNYFDYLQYLQEGGKNSMGTTGSIPTTGGAGFVPSNINTPTYYNTGEEVKPLTVDEAKA